MATESRQPTWTDERLDDMKTGSAPIDRPLSQSGEWLARVDASFDALDATMTDGFARIDVRFDGLDERLDSLQRTMVLGMIGLVGTTVASALATIVALA